MLKPESYFSSHNNYSRPSGHQAHSARGELGDLCPPLPLCVERGLNTPTLTIPDWLVSFGFEICLFESKSYHHGFFQFIGDTL